MSSDAWFKFIDELDQIDTDFLKEMKERFQLLTFNPNAGKVGI